MRRIFCVLLSLLILSGVLMLCAPQAGAAETDGFVPVFRFIVCSDTHVRDDNDVTLERIGKMLALGYEAAEKAPEHNTLDAFIVCGDLTNDGTTTEFDRFWGAVSGAKKDETQFLGVVAKNHDGYLLSRTELRSYFEELTGCSADFHVVLGGYHFIGVSASPNDSKRYDKDQLAWLRAQLDAAVADAPDRPVFVMHHEHNRKTVYGSSLYDGWGVKHFLKILKDYPQAVDFSGHSHYPLNDPRSVWQGTYTAIGTGAIYYSEFTVSGIRCYHPDDSNDTATCWIVELNAENDLHLVGMDVEAGEPLCDFILKNPADPANRDLTPEKRKAASLPPAFASDAALTVTSAYGACTVTAPAAESTDGQPVVLYRIKAKDKHGLTATKTWVMPSYYRAVAQEDIEFSLQGLAAGAYTLTVTAETAYGVQSEPLQATVTVEGDGVLKTLPTRFKLLFEDIKNYFRKLFW